MRLAHVINPVKVSEASDLFIAQPIVFQSMRRAKAFVEGKIEIEFLSTQFPEDLDFVPKDFVPTENLTRSIRDLKGVSDKRRLPYIADILFRAFHSSDADYLIYTNSDICLQEHFYMAIQQYIELGYDAFSITRRTIPDHYKSPNQLPEMYLELGKPHQGWDCFVFRRTATGEFKFARVFVGLPGIGRALLCNMICSSSQFKLISDAHLTFHIGEDSAWTRQTAGQVAANTFNKVQAMATIRALRTTANDPEKRALIHAHYIEQKSRTDQSLHISLAETYSFLRCRFGPNLVSERAFR